MQVIPDRGDAASFESAPAVDAACRIGRKGVPILKGGQRSARLAHRTLFSPPEDNIIEIYAEFDSRCAGHRLGFIVTA